MGWQTKKELIRDISIALIEAQAPIRVLDSVKIDNSIISEFTNSKYKSIPKINADYYKNQNQIGYNKHDKEIEFSEIKKKVQLEFGETDDLGQLLIKYIDQYITLTKLQDSRGTKEFYKYSCELYGSSKSHIMSDTNTVTEMALLLYSILSGIKTTMPPSLRDEKSLSPSHVVDQLKLRLDSYFNGEAKVLLSDGIIADAAAGGDSIKINSESRFSLADIDILEVHEGWVHVGTTLNGRRQNAAKFISLGPPRCTSTQEGLAVLMEILSFHSSVKRAQKINDRIMAISKAEDGADIVEVFEFFRTEGYSEAECITNSFRVFRGGPLTGGYPFTKDISYCKGFVEVYNFLRACIRAGKPYLIPFVFSGKLHVEDVPLVYSLFREGIIDPPVFVPERFKEINGLAVWMSFSSFFNKVDLASVQKHFNSLFKQYL